MSDGCPHASVGLAYNSNWSREDIAEYMQSISYGGYTAKTMSTMLVDECNKLYGYEPVMMQLLVLCIRKKNQ